MKKRLLSLLLSFVLILSLAPSALAAEKDTLRETNFFTDQKHADVDFADMEYVHIDSKPILEELSAIRELAKDKANAEKALERCSTVMDKILELATMYTLANIRHSQNVMDEEAVDELTYCEAAYIEVSDAVSQLIRDALQSPCADLFKKDMSEEDIAYYLSYTDLSEEQKSLFQQETALVTKYNQAAANITVVYQGKEWTDNSAYFAQISGELSKEDYMSIHEAIVEKQNQVLGGIYLEMIPLRNKIAESCGYDSYPDYAYETIYQRGYSPEDIREFHEAVKSVGFYEISTDLLNLSRASMDPDVYYADYTGDETLALIEGYIGRMSSEMAEAYAYMRKHGLYDVKEADYKDGSGYTTFLTGYGAPFFFNTPMNFFGDFTCAVHEFGHYNQFYWVGADLESRSKSYDILEVHSQALELLFSHWYGEIFEDSAQFCTDYLLAALTQSISEGAIHDEFQQYAYSAGDLTLEKLNRKYRQLCAEYGMVEEDDPREELYDWAQIPHTFTDPCYYISYAVSAAGAFAFWLDAQQGEYFDAVDNYLRFCALPGDLGFQESFEKMKMDNPLSAEYLTELSKALRTALDLDERIAALPPSDLKGTEWFAEAALALYGTGVIEKEEDGLIHPYDQALWSDAAALMERLTKSLPKMEDGEAVITRLEFARLLVAELRLEEASGAPFSDTDDGAVGALAEWNAITGYADGTFRPDQPMNRAEMWVIVYRVLMGAVAKLVEGAAA